MVTAEYTCDEFIAEDDVKAFEEFFNTYKEQTKGVRIEYLMHDIDFKTAVRNMHSIVYSIMVELMKIKCETFVSQKAHKIKDKGLKPLSFMEQQTYRS